MIFYRSEHDTQGLRARGTGRRLRVSHGRIRPLLDDTMRTREKRGQMRNVTILPLHRPDSRITPFAAGRRQPRRATVVVQFPTAPAEPCREHAGQGEPEPPRPAA